MQPTASDRKVRPSALTFAEFILFDAVGTLIFADPAPARVYHEIGQRFGSNLSVDQANQRFLAAFKKHHISGPTAEAVERWRWQQVVADVFGTEPDSDLFNALWDHFSHYDSWKLYPDVADVFVELERRGIPFGIASNFDARLLSICGGLSPLNRVQKVFHSAAVGWSKPDPNFFAHVQRQLGVDASKILLVGDDKEKDFAGATNAGWQALLIDRNGTTDGNAISKLTELF
jgi:putative hydrolase of the HAD superfamily